MPLVHESGGDRRVLATEVDRAETVLSRAVGLMFRRSVPDDYALAFPFDGAGTRYIHTVFVRFPIDVVWVADSEVRAVRTLRPWLGLAGATADVVYELPAGGAAGVEPGDRVAIEATGPES